MTIKVVIAALVALVGVIAAALVANVSNLPVGAQALAGLAASAAVAIGGLGVSLLTGAQFTLLKLPHWVHVTIAVALVLAGLLGIRSQAVPVSKRALVLDGLGTRIPGTRIPGTPLSSSGDIRHRY